MLTPLLIGGTGLQGYQLSEYETMVFVPCLVEKAGHNQVRCPSHNMLWITYLTAARQHTIYCSLFQDSLNISPVLSPFLEDNHVADGSITTMVTVPFHVTVCTLLMQ